MKQYKLMRPDSIYFDIESENNPMVCRRQMKGCAVFILVVAIMLMIKMDMRGRRNAGENQKTKEYHSRQAQAGLDSERRESKAWI